MIARLEFEALIGALARKAATLKPTAPATYRPINQMRKLDTLQMRISAA